MFTQPHSYPLTAATTPSWRVMVPCTSVILVENCEGKAALGRRDLPSQEDLLL